MTNRLIRLINEKGFAEPPNAKSLLDEPLVIHQRTKPTRNNSLLVFVHGWGGRRYGPRSSWGRFPELLFRDFPTLDIGLYTYRTRFGRLKFLRSIPLDEEARIFADTLRDLEEYRKIVLLGHSMGGLLCMGAIAHLTNTRDLEPHKEALSRIKGLMLFAVPQLGSLRVPPLLSFLSLDLLALKPHGKFVSQIQHTFSTRLYLNEKGSASGKPRVPMWAVVAASDFLVDRLSASIHLPEDRTRTVHGLHGEIVKPTFEDSNVYGFVKKRVQICLEDNTTTDYADLIEAHGRHGRHSAAEKFYIEYKAADQNGALQLDEIVEKPRRNIDALPGLDLGIPVGHQETEHREDFSTKLRLPPELKFVGRPDEVTSLTEHIGSTDLTILVTLTGSPGVGKSRLGHEVARHLEDKYPGTIRDVDLVTIRDHERVAELIARAFGVYRVGLRADKLDDALIRHLSNKPALLLLDNAECLVEHADIIAKLLNGCKRLKILVMSRELLKIHEWEHEVPVLPMEVPDLDKLPNLDALKQIDSIKLFTEAARMAYPKFEITDANAYDAAAICVHTEGLPLAIILLVAWIKKFPSLGKLLESASPLLIRESEELAGNPDKRHRTMSAAIAWSYNCLEPEEQRLFRQLGVFIGGWNRSAAEAVCNAGSRSSIYPRLFSLVEKSLLGLSQGRSSEMRFKMLEFVREFALSRLQGNDAEGTQGKAKELMETKMRHLDYYLDLVRNAKLHLFGEQEKEWLDRIEDDIRNIEAAINFAKESQQTERCLELATKFGWCCEVRSFVGEGRRCLRTALDIPEAKRRTSLGARALHMDGRLATFQDEYDIAVELFSESRSIAEELNDKYSLANALSGLALVSSHRGLHDDSERRKAANLYEQSLELWQDPSMSWEEDILSAEMRERERKREAGYIYDRLAMLANDEGEFERALEHAMRSLKLRKEVGNHNGVAQSLRTVGQALAGSGRHDAAKERFEEASEIYKELDNPSGQVWCLEDLGHLKLQVKDYEGAQELLVEALRRRYDMGEQDGGPSGIATCLLGLGCVAWWRNDKEKAWCLWGRAEKLMHDHPDTRLDCRTFSNYCENRPQENQPLVNPALQKARLKGYNQLTLEQAIGLARGEDFS